MTRIAGYATELQSLRGELAAYVGQSLWLDGDFAARVDANLSGTAANLSGLTERAQKVRGEFLLLPRLPADNGSVPDPVAHEPISA